MKTLIDKQVNLMLLPPRPRLLAAQFERRGTRLNVSLTFENTASRGGLTSVSFHGQTQLTALRVWKALCITCRNSVTSLTIPRGSRSEKHRGVKSPELVT